jgi:hypothetical protein
LGTEARGGPDLSFKVFWPKAGFLRLFCIAKINGHEVISALQRQRRPLNMSHRLPKRPGPYILALLVIILAVLVAWMYKALDSIEPRTRKLPSVVPMADFAAGDGGLILLIRPPVVQG